MITNEIWGEQRQQCEPTEKSTCASCFEFTSADFTYVDDDPKSALFERNYSVCMICAQTVADHTFETGSGCPRLLS